MEKLIVTIACKLNPNSKQVSKINATLKAFAGACNYINEVIDTRIVNNVRIQTLVYEDIRTKFDLSANLAIRAINRVAGNRKIAKKEKQPVKYFKPTSVDYDARIFSLREKDWTASLTLVGGRERLNLCIDEDQISLLQGQKPVSAILSQLKDSNYTLNIQVLSSSPQLRETDPVIIYSYG